MKPLTFTVLFTCFSIFSFSQDFKIRLFAEDAVGRKDTITIGFDTSSTLGIDASLGEVNLYGIAWDSLDMRVIQRDSANHNCVRTTHYQDPPAPDLYFPENVDSKVDFRKSFVHPNFLDNNFEIYIHAVDFPVYLFADFSEIMQGFDASHIHQLDANCDSDWNTVIHMSPDMYSVNDTIFTLPNSTYNTFVANFDVLINTEKIIPTQPVWKLFPNPANELITISALGSINGTLEIFSIAGQLVRSEVLTKHERLEIPVQELSKGFYFVKIFDETNQLVSTRKFMKQ